MLIFLAAIAGVVLGWALGPTVDTFLDAKLSVYPKKTILTACAIVIVVLAVMR